MKNAFIFHKSHYILFEKGGVQMHVKRYSWFKTEPCQELRSSTACPVFFPLLLFFFFFLSIWRISFLLNLLLVQLKHSIPCMSYSLPLNPKQGMCFCIPPYSSVLLFVELCAQPQRLLLPLIHCDTLLLQCLISFKGNYILNYSL